LYYEMAKDEKVPSLFSSKGACRVPARSLHFFPRSVYHAFVEEAAIKPSEIFRAFPFLDAMPREAKEELSARAVTKNLSHKQVLVSGGGDCQHLSGNGGGGRTH
jgi:hypothetical protein